MFIVGLTGGISTGKSTVAEMIREYGIPVLDADFYARKVVEPGRIAWKKIKQEFGDAVFHPTGELNREALGEIIFQDKEQRRKLNQITHPEIYKEMTWAAIKCFFQGHQFIVMDLPLLFESGAMLNYLYKIIVVTCEEDLQVERLIERNRMTEARAKIRIAAQMPLERKAEAAHFVIENSGNLEDTREQKWNKKNKQLSPVDHRSNTLDSVLSQSLTVSYDSSSHDPSYVPKISAIEDQVSKTVEMPFKCVVLTHGYCFIGCIEKNKNDNLHLRIPVTADFHVARIVCILKASNHHWKLRLIAGILCCGVVSFMFWAGSRFLQGKVTAR